MFTSTNRGAPRGKASTSATRAAASRRCDDAGGHAAQQHPADDHARGSEGEGEGARGESARRRCALRRPRPIDRGKGALEELFNEGVLAFKCFLAESGVDEFSHVHESELRAGMVELARIARRSSFTRSCPRRSRKARRRPWASIHESTRRISRRVHARPKTPRSSSCSGSRRRPARAPTSSISRPRTRSRCSRKQGSEDEDHGRDLPALPHVRIRGDPRRRYRIQVRTTDPRGK